jgi:hypothetical protein
MNFMLIFKKYLIVMVKTHELYAYIEKNFNYITFSIRTICLYPKIFIYNGINI